MALIKSKKDIQQLIEGGKLIGEIMQELYDMIVPGISTLDIDRLAEEKINKVGGIPAFKGYGGDKSHSSFPATVCVCIDDEVVHGIPSQERVLEDGNIVTVDIGMLWPRRNGLFTDTAFTRPVGKISKKTQKLLDATADSLEAGLSVAIAGNSLADIGRAVEDTIKARGKYGIVRNLCGHGVGHAVHEEPFVLNYYNSALESWKLESGMVLAIEPIINMGKHRVMTDDDDWTVRTADGSLSAHFEHTVVITDDQPIVVTRRPREIKSL